MTNRGPPERRASGSEVRSLSVKGPSTLFDKVWDEHVAVPSDVVSPAVIYVDLHLIHEVTSPQAFSVLRRRGLKVRRPGQTLGVMDHSTPTIPRDRKGRMPVVDEQAANQLETFARNCREFGIELFELGHEDQGIVHVVGPELGLTQPGSTVVCGDSHTSTHGAFGALAFGIGTSEVGHVLATQSLLQHRPRSMAIRLEGRPGEGVGAKDLVLAVIAQVGVDGGTGHVVEYRGEAVRGLSMEGRMTVCNMSIEAGARAGMIAPDDTTFEYLAGRRYAPRGRDWERAMECWRRLPSDEGATYDAERSVDVSSLAPMVTFGTNPGMAIPVDGRMPDPARIADLERRRALERAFDYMDLVPGERLLGQPIDVVFLGSCTNSRISDLREAAGLLKGRRIDEGVRMLVVPGSQRVKAQAEAEGLHRVFVEAGADWREAGCSMCIAMNGDQALPGEYAVSTSNRNFEGRQGRGARTFLASPLTAAASALLGRVADPRRIAA